MPLQRGSSDKVKSENIAELIRAGHPTDQAAAIAYREAGEDAGAPAMRTARAYDANGWYEIDRNPLSSVGVFPYSGRQIQRFINTPDPADPDRMYRVLRPEEELRDPETIASFRLLPWTDGHAMLGDPEEFPGVVPAESRGVEGVIGDHTGYDPETRTLYGNVKVFGQHLANLIASGKKELSCGYRCVYELCSGEFEGQPYDAIQRRIRGNHLATVPRGRMGPGVSVLDELSFALDEREFTPMAHKKTSAFRSRLMGSLKVTDPTQLGAAIAAHPEAVIAAMDAEEAEPSTADPQISDVIAMLKPLTEITAAIKALGMAGKPAEEPDGDEGAGEEVTLDADTPAAPAPAAPAPVAPASGAAMDAAYDARLQALEKRSRVPSMKDMLAEVSRRDKLAEQLSGFVGTFDSAEMTEQEVAKYGIEKLGISAPAGQEIGAIGAYLFNRTPPAAKASFALDGAADGSAGGAKLDAYLNGRKA